MALIGVKSSPGRTKARLLEGLASVCSAWLLVACQSAPPLAATDAQPPAAKPGPVTPPPPGNGVLASSEHLAVYIPKADDTFATIALRFLGDASRDWEIADINDLARPRPGAALIVPLKPVNPVGVRAGQMQTIPILCYHRVGPGTGKMFVSAASFAQQMEWLASNGYRLIRLKDLTGFMEGRQALPPKAVVLTFDDGYESFYRYAYPLLKKYAFPATVFLYTDFVGAGDALSWNQMQEMVGSGLVSIQAHSKTHANLMERGIDETDARYRQRIDAEARLPREQIERRLQQEVNYFAYPFGDANEAVLDAMAKYRYRIGVTVNPGGNAFYAQPLMLRRTMIYGSHDLNDFKARLQTSRSFAAP